MDVGMHCSVGACSQVDFLPFTCDCCRSVFCLDHRTYDAHECPLAGSKDRRVIECPLCNQMMHWTSEQDVNAVWERHVQGGECAPKGSDAGGSALGGGGAPAKKKKKPRCGADKCREILTASNQFSCTKCRQNVCLKHRFESDHDCEKVRAQQRRTQQQSWGFSRNSNATPRGGSANATNANRRSTAGVRAGGSGTDTAQLQQSAKKVATDVVNGTKSAMSSLVQNAKAAGASVSAASANLITTNSEECPICQKKFAYVSQLIAHVDNAHPDATSSRGGSSAARPIDLTTANGSTAAAAAAAVSGREVCPQCRAVFSDINALIQHAESAHAGAVAAAEGGADGRRGSGASNNGQEKCSVQ